MSSESQIVVGVSKKDSRKHTPSMTIGELAALLEAALPVEDVCVQIQGEDGSFTYRRVGSLRLEFFPATDSQAAQPSSSPSQAKEPEAKPVGHLVPHKADFIENLKRYAEEEIPRHQAEMVAAIPPQPAQEATQEPPLDLTDDAEREDNLEIPQAIIADPNMPPPGTMTDFKVMRSDGGDAAQHDHFQGEKWW